MRIYYHTVFSGLLRAVAVAEAQNFTAYQVCTCTSLLMEGAIKISSNNTADLATAGKWTMTTTRKTW